MFCFLSLFVKCCQALLDYRASSEDPSPSVHPKNLTQGSKSYCYWYLSNAISFLGLQSFSAAVKGQNCLSLFLSNAVKLSWITKLHLKILHQVSIQRALHKSQSPIVIGICIGIGILIVTCIVIAKVLI